MFHPSVSDGLDDGPMTTRIPLVDKTGNQINTIYPYRTQYGGWAFDDAEVGLFREPFVLGIPAIIDSIVGDRDNFTAYISHSKIPKATGHLVKVKEPEGLPKTEGEDTSDGWYQLKGTDMIGWLCPATLKYFKDYPENIYFRIE